MKTKLLPGLALVWSGYCRAGVMPANAANLAASNVFAGDINQWDVQGSDAPGYFQLRGVRTGRVLHEQKVVMIQLVDRINWAATNVDVHLLADWSLPL